MTWADRFLVFMALQDVIAAIAYFYNGDLPRAFYWLLAGFMVVSTYYMGKF